ncbi:MAG: RNA polymerase factor sigma-54 [Deltaproteobacteria bacterium]|nr:RNA polymerase factor sigma-54 [Deltaproteobacteria bacterium]
MAIELKQSLKLSQQLVMTPQLQQAIKMLQVTRMELTDLIEQALEENPLLEVEEIGDDASKEIAESDLLVLDSVEPKTPVSQELTGTGDGKDEFDWGNYLEDYSTAPQQRQGDDEVSWDNFLTKPETLIDHLMWQLKMSQAGEEEFLAAEFIIKSLDDDGYLKISLAEIARELSCDLSLVEVALSRVQDFDPAGVAAQDLQECLLLQAKSLGSTYLVHEIIINHLKDLELRNYSLLAKKLKVTEDEMMMAVKIIRAMNPKPGSGYGEESRTQSITPDVFIVATDDGYRVILNEEGIPRLCISNLYQEIISHTEDKTEKNNNRRYINERMQSAKWLLKSLEQRQTTIRLVAESIIRFQRDFFDKGADCMKPLILRDVAEDINMHESTVSRVVSNKYASTPRGTFILKYFFSNSLSTSAGEEIATAAVKEEIKKILLSENQDKPYNDIKIARMLQAQGIQVARRTVAKYREALNILPSSKRKRFRE